MGSELKKFQYIFGGLLMEVAVALVRGFKLNQSINQSNLFEVDSKIQ